MPRSGPPTYTYTLPPVYLAIPGTTILVDQHNTPLEDIASTFNSAQPVVWGGTGATTVAGAKANLGYLYQSWESYTAATNPVDANNLILTPTDALLALATGVPMTFTVGAAANTGAATLNVSGTGVKAIRKISGGTDVALSSGDLAIASKQSVVYDSAANSAAGAWILTGSATVAPATTTTPGTVQLATNPQTLAGTPFGRVPTIENLYLPTGFLYGLTLTNAAGDPTNDILVAVGSARDSTDSYNYLLGSALTKQTDVAWALGNNAGSLDTGAIGNNRYAIWGIGRSDTRVCDVLTSLSFSSPTMPADYDFKVLIGEFTRTGGVNGVPIWYGASRPASGRYQSAHVLIPQTAISSAATLDIVLTSYLGSYSNFEIELINLIPATDNVSFQSRLSADGSAWDSGAGAYKWGYGSQFANGATYFGSNSNSDTLMQIMNNVGNGSGEGFSATIRLMDVNNSAVKPRMRFHGDCYLQDDTSGGEFGTGMRNNAQVTRGWRGFFSSGNIASGKYILRGLVG